MSAAVIILAAVLAVTVTGGLIAAYRRRRQSRAEWLADLDNDAPDRHWDDVRRQLGPPPRGWRGKSDPDA